MKPEPSTAQFRFACAHCRKMLRKTFPRFFYPRVEHHAPVVACAECGNPAVFVGRYFEPPRRNDLKAWKQLELAHFEPGSYRDATGKYRAKMPPQIAKQRALEAQQRYLSRVEGTKCRQRQKQQERLVSRSRSGQSLTNVSAA